MTENQPFIISDQILRNVCRANQYAIPESDQLVLFGIRGTLPYPLNNYSVGYGLSERHKIITATVDYHYPNCLLGIWLPFRKRLAVFPGSTVPNLPVIHENGCNFYQYNCMLPGCYNYKMGTHPADSLLPGRDQALRVDDHITLSRSNYQLRGSDLKICFDKDSSIYIGSSGDHIHCADTSMPASLFRNNKKAMAHCLTSRFSSYGCQVVVGQRQYKDEGESSWNAWRSYIECLSYHRGAGQQQFRYLLFDRKEIFAGSGRTTEFKLRYGSQGPLVSRLQSALQSVREGRTGSPYLKEEENAQFKEATARALLAYQTDVFGKALGYAGEKTMERLGIRSSKSARKEIMYS